MAHRGSKKPQVSVLLAVRDAQDGLMRTAESVLSQSLRDLELVVVDCSSTDHTSDILDRLADRDIRVEVRRVDAPVERSGLDAAFEAARAPYALVMGQGDWLGPDYLERLVRVATNADAELVFPAPESGSVPRTASVSRAAVGERSWSSARDFHRAAMGLLGPAHLASPVGKLILTDLAREVRASVPAGVDGFSLALSYLRGVSRAEMVAGPVYHSAPMARRVGEAFDPGLYPACERRYAALLDLLRDWGIDGDPACAEPVHRMHLAAIICCIENASLGVGGLSSIERRERVQDMIDAPSTRDSVRALHASSRDFGLMFAPIARRSASACCMGARITDLIDRALNPIARQRAACL